VSTSEHIHYDVSDGIATITIDRPEKRNALSYAMYDATRFHVTQAEEDPAVKAIILTAVAGQFCAGTDLTELERVNGNGDSARSDSGHHLFLYECTKPVIAAIDGPAAGLGVELCTQSDFRIASSQARFSWIFVQRGLVPDTGAGTWLLPRQVGPQQAKRLVYSGEFLSAEEALKIGFVIDVVAADELQQAARDLAKSVSNGSPFAIRRAKALIDDGFSRTLTEHLEASDQAILECRLSEDHREGVAAFLEKRPAVFTGR
jgi:2-(1,2-epoxy-1,2-dihydrophenyl)acetyl-CoA isomerase